MTKEEAMTRFMAAKEKKRQCVERLEEKMKPATADTMSTEQMLEGYPYKHHTKAELNAMLDEAEARFEAGLGIPHEEVMREMNEELRPYTMQEIDDMLDEAEAAFEAGDYLTNEEVFHRHKANTAV